MDKRAFRIVVALGLLLAGVRPASAQLMVTLKDANNPASTGVPCIAEMSSGDKKPSFKTGDSVSWLIDGNSCKSSYSAAAMRVKFGKNSKLIKGGNGGSLKTCVPQSMYTCLISATISSKLNEAPDKSRHPYAITLNDDDTGDPELDIDNGGGAPPPPGPPPAPAAGRGSRGRR